MEKVLQKVWTDEELMQLPNDGTNDWKVELVNGEPQKMSPAGFLHGMIAVRLVRRLEEFADAHSLGMVLDSSTGFRMRNRNVRVPDVAFVSSERLKNLKHPLEGFFEGSPDLAVEVLLPNDTAKELHKKMTDYFESGTKLAWAINPEDETVIVYHRPSPGGKVLRRGDTLDGETLLPHFSMPVALLFTMPAFE